MNDRVKFFLKYGIFTHPDYDFIVISNGYGHVDVPSHVKLLLRENVGFDFGGWSDALLNDNLYKQYTHFVFINSSVYGPFVPTYYNDVWPTLFTKRLTTDLRLFGTTINSLNDAKSRAMVQSMAYSTDLEALEVLIQEKIFTRDYPKTFDETIWQHEIRMSRVIINHGWNIGCLMKIYEGVDFRFKTSQPNDQPIKFLNDVNWNHIYFGNSMHPYEIIFLKGNRDIDMNWMRIYFPKPLRQIERITAASYGVGYSTVDVLPKVREIISNGELILVVDNTTLGIDPYYGKEKTLSITMDTGITTTYLERTRIVIDTLFN